MTNQKDEESIIDPNSAAGKEISAAFGRMIASEFTREFSFFFKGYRRTERWNTIRRILWGAFLFAATIFQVMLIARWLGVESLDSNTEVAVVQLSGAVGAGDGIMADTAIPVLKAAFESPTVTAIVLRIDSPGGSPTEADRISDAIKIFREKNPKPVQSICLSMCASAGYMLALNGDSIYAGRYSWVGSIGAIMKTWDVSKLVKRADVAQHTFASGPLKAMGDMFNPYSEQTLEKLQGLVDSAANVFKASVTQIRGGKLKQGVNIYTGEVWGGDDALALGLIDGVASPESFMNSLYPSAKVQVIKPTPINKGLFSKSSLMSLVGIETSEDYSPVSFEY